MWVAAGMTLFMFSFLYKDNPFYKVGEHLFVGVTIGYTIITLWYESWLPKVWRIVHPEAEAWFENREWWLLIFPVLLGVMVLTRFVPKWAWMSRWTFAFIVGYGSGLAIPATFATSIQKQAVGTVKPLLTRSPDAEGSAKAADAAEEALKKLEASAGWGAPETRAARVEAEQLRALADAAKAARDAVKPAEERATELEKAADEATRAADAAAKTSPDSDATRAARKTAVLAESTAISARIAAHEAASRTEYTLLTFYRDASSIVLFLGVISVLVYFFFSIEHKGAVKWVSYVGISFLMIYFGASYGYTVMGRLSLLYGRLSTLKLGFYPEFGFATPVLLTVMIGVLVGMHLAGRGKGEGGEQA